MYTFGTFILLGVPTVALALSDPLASSALQDAFRVFVQNIIFVAYPAIAVAFMWSGFLFVQAQGNEEQLQRARKTLLWVSIGALVILGLWSIIRIAGETIATLSSVALLVVMVLIVVYMVSRGR